MQCVIQYGLWRWVILEPCEIRLSPDRVRQNQIGSLLDHRQVDWRNLTLVDEAIGTKSQGVDISA